MSGTWDDRKKALEEDYFRRKEQEAIEKQRAKREAEEETAKAEASLLECPRCDGKLVELKYEDVLIDRCNKCNGVWLDAGELEHIMGHEEGGGFFGRMWRSISGD
ncbi:MAG: zf-TFIIB domain-containing protein [Blastocatellia bacterium]|nr:zf-TFIIB domain-containing protein [Blastocatellia bacterium]